MLVKTASKNILWLSSYGALKLEVLKKKVFRCDIRDFQNAVTFLFEEIEQKFWHTSESS